MRKAWRYMPQNKYMRMAAVMLAGCNQRSHVRARKDLAAQGRAAASHAPLAVDLPACERARRRLAAEAGAGEPGAQPAEPENESGVMRGARSPAGGEFSSSHVPCTAVGERARAVGEIFEKSCVNSCRVLDDFAEITGCDRGAISRAVCEIVLSVKSRGFLRFRDPPQLRWTRCVEAHQAVGGSLSP